MGGLSQLVAVGAQNVYLHGTASLFRQRYAKHTNFAVESIDLMMEGEPEFGGRSTCDIARKGDLVTNIVVEITMKKSGDTFYPAEHLLKEVELHIGGQKIDSITNTWLRLYDELYRPVDEREAHAQMTDFRDEPVGSVKRFFVRLPFFFSRGVTTALPIIALQYHDVSLSFEFEDAKNIPGIDPSFRPEVTVWADYVFLDTAERMWFAHQPHTYMIEQTQVIKETISFAQAPRTRAVNLPFNHPVKYLVWVLKPNAESHGIFTASGEGLESREVCGPLDTCGLHLNGVERFKERRGAYFRLAHPITTFGQAPSVGVYVYSFSAYPKKLAPSGNLNCSRVDDLRLMIRPKSATLASAEEPALENQTLAATASMTQLEVYARAYNVLNLASGMAGLAFSS